MENITFDTVREILVYVYRARTVLLQTSSYSTAFQTERKLRSQVLRTLVFLQPENRAWLAVT